jgi:uncharacterized protein YgiM (DUF1202 family)
MKLRLQFTSALVLLSLLLVSATAVVAQNADVLVGRAVFDTNIRATPGVHSAVIGVLPGNQEVVTIGRTPANNWVQIEYQETVGWVAAWLLVFSNDTSKLIVTTDIQPAPTTTGGPFIARSPYNTNIRVAPDVNAEVLIELPYNTNAIATGRTENSSWIRVTYSGVEGWAAAWLTTLDQDIIALPVAGGAVFPTPTPNPNATPTATPTGPPPTATPSSEPPAPSSAITVLAPFRLNIRSEPILDSNVIDVLPFSTPTPAVGRNAANNWIQIKYGSTTGWVASWLVIATDNTNLLPVTSSSTKVTPIPGSALITASSIYDITIRAGPGLIFNPQSTLPANTEVTPTARSEHNDWLKIVYQGSEGWISAWNMVGSGDFANLPVETSPLAP